MTKKDRLIEIMTSALGNGLCGGCETSPSPYAYENGGSCDKCRHIAAIEIASIIRSDAQTVDAVPVRCKDCKFFSHGYCRFHEAKFVNPKAYCFWGERKDGDSNG